MSQLLCFSHHIKIFFNNNNSNNTVYCNIKLVFKNYDLRTKLKQNYVFCFYFIFFLSSDKILHFKNHLRFDIREIDCRSAAFPVSNSTQP